MWKGIKRKLYFHSFVNAVIPTVIVNLGVYFYAGKLLPGLMIFIVFVGFFMWLLGLFFSNMFMDRIYAVIKNIQSGMEMIDHGEVFKTVSSKDGDEFDKLSDAINKMIKAINERDKLKVDKSELEIISKELTEKNIELGEFIYSISHDLRAPVVSISGYSSILIEEYADKLGEEGKKYLKRISENTAYMEQLIHDLIDLSRAERINFAFQEVDVSELIEAVTSQYSEEIRKRNIDFSVKCNIKKIYADKNRLIQVFSNLIGNAIKYADVNKKSSIEVGGDIEDDYFKFFIKDNGVGISKADQSKIFKLFYRVDGTGVSGTGVGLNIVKKIVERHQGKVWVESELGKGSTFYFAIYKSICDINEKNEITQ